jgi:predicted nucleic acid-binding protein
MKKVLVDTNVILDVLLDRQPHVTASAALWAVIETGRVQGFLAAHALTTIHYLIGKEHGGAKAKRLVSTILKVFRVAPVTGDVIQEALDMPAPDFEDAVTAAAARSSGCDLIVTRDPRGFRGSPVRVLTPETAVPLLAQR